MKALLLVDGEHYPPVTRWGIEVARERGLEPVAALLVGGGEKLAADHELDLGIPLTRSDADTSASLTSMLTELRPEVVLDLSDEPVLGYRERMELVAVALAAGVPYLGPDFRLDPPIEGPPLGVPTVAVIGTGKRTGKTAIAGEVARVAAKLGRDPILVAMGRGGPPAPQVAEAGSVDLARLLELRRAGQHAASDYLEDALMAGVTTIGARRAGGGLAGRPYATNVREAAELAVERGPGLVILEGSGSAIPPVPWDAGILVVPASAPPEYLGGYLGPYRLLLSDLVVFTMGAGPSGLENLSVLRSHVRRYQADAREIITDFIPVPLADVRGRRAFFITTAPESAAARQVQHLEAEAGCSIVGWSARLADRAGLAEDLESADRYDVLLTELKAAAVDTGADMALARGAEVVFVDNRATVVEGSADLRTTIAEVLDLANERGSSR
ncbi:MAG TPA: 2,3-diphosphoglycerate synthetase [Actinomycetota bacterium]